MTPQRALRVPDEEWLAAMAKAQAEGVTLTDIIRKALREFINTPTRSTTQQ